MPGSRRRSRTRSSRCRPASQRFRQCRSSGSRCCVYRPRTCATVGGLLHSGIAMHNARNVPRLSASASLTWVSPPHLAVAWHKPVGAPPPPSSAHACGARVGCADGHEATHTVPLSGSKAKPDGLLNPWASVATVPSEAIVRIALFQESATYLRDRGRICIQWHCHA